MEKTNGYSLNLPLVSATASSGAATANGVLVKVTSESLSTAAGAEYTLTLTNKSIASTSSIFASTGLGSSTTGIPGIGGVTVTDGQAVVTVTNLHASAAFNGTIVIQLLIVNGK